MTAPYLAPPPHLAFPLVLTVGGSFAQVAQDSIEEVTQSVAFLLGSAIGSRTIVPAYGVPDPTFTDPDQAEIEQAIANWEPRAQATVTVTENAGRSASVSVQVALATSS